MLAETKPVLYQLCDLMKADVPGFYYREQLTLTKEAVNNRLFEVESVLKTKTVKKKKWFLCKFLFYPSKFNEWVAEEDMQDGDLSDDEAADDNKDK